VEKLLSPPSGISRSLAVLATGGGKTIIFAAYLDRLLRTGERALVLAHREELLTQAHDKMAVAAPSLHVEIEQAEKRASKSMPRSLLHSPERSVVVGSVQTMRGKRLASWAPDAFSSVVIDEAHHAVAPGYADILRHFGCLGGSTRLVGVTATPGRTDGVGLGAIFQEIAVEYSIRDLIGMGYLCPIRAHLVRSNVSLDGIKQVAGDFSAGELQQRVNVAERNEAVVSAYEKYAPDRQAIVFTAGVEHAHSIADLMAARGINARSVWGDMDKDQRRSVLDDFQAGKVKVLTNFGVLTEGFDAPATSCIIMARPTRSALIVTQCIGRGTRLAPGKTDCLVLDIRDSVSKLNLCSAATLAGLPPHFDPQGGDVLALGAEMEDLDPRLQSQAIDREQLGKFVAQIKQGMSVAEIDLFAAIKTDPRVKEVSQLKWMQTGGDAWAIRIPKTGEQYHMHVDTLGNHVLTQDGHPLAVEKDAHVAFRYADAWLRMQHPEAAHLLDANADWTRKEASEAQLKTLAKLAKGRELPPKLSRGDASMLIDSLQSSRPATAGKGV
jgi:superfamily II DNA or RNA helicase